jgi:hypothetical protein
MTITREQATIKDAPAVLNLNDKAMWVLGYNAALASQHIADVQAEGSYPALPEPEVYHQDTCTEDQITGYDADQMRAFADATVAHRQQQAAAKGGE